MLATVSSNQWLSSCFCQCWLYTSSSLTSGWGRAPSSNPLNPLNPNAPAPPAPCLFVSPRACRSLRSVPSSLAGVLSRHRCAHTAPRERKAFAADSNVILQICYDRHTGKPLGYAVVHFDNPAAAQYAIDVLHNIEVDGRHIVVAPYRPRAGDPTAPKQPPKPPGGPSADEAVALVMDLHKNATWMCAPACLCWCYSTSLSCTGSLGVYEQAHRLRQQQAAGWHAHLHGSPLSICALWAATTGCPQQPQWPLLPAPCTDAHRVQRLPAVGSWSTCAAHRRCPLVCRDLKDILSQQSKVLFVDEPRMVRAAVVHFASVQDRDQARAVFRNSNILGGAVDIVPVRPRPISPQTTATHASNSSHALACCLGGEACIMAHSPQAWLHLPELQGRVAGVLLAILSESVAFGVVAASSSVLTCLHACRLTGTVWCLTLD